MGVSKQEGDKYEDNKREERGDKHKQGVQDKQNKQVVQNEKRVSAMCMVHYTLTTTEI